uniref:Acyltransferase 3 domain-containing protein n=1 Tax=Acrobeloides nanus TaxID=290746 RepID=A0A914D5G7_9BILA
MVYIGDISYILYLAHWPIIEMVKYYSGEENNCLNYELILLQFSFLISIIVHHLIEKPLINSKIDLTHIFFGCFLAQMILICISYFEPPLPV